MSTTLAKAGEIERKWFLIDAAGKPLGRVAAQAAVLLRGKNKVTFTPNVDCGDHVIIVNTDKAVLTGKKLEKKYYRTHSGWIGGLKETQYKTLMAENSDKAMYLAVKGMVPSNAQGAKAMTRLHCYKGAEMGLRQALRQCRTNRAHADDRNAPCGHARRARHS